MNGYDWDRCQGYMRHLDEQHKQLNQELRRLHDAMQSGAARPAILSDLEALRRDLAAHFREEEDGGCLEEAVSRCASLAHDVRMIESEHRELLAQLDAMLARLRRAGTIASNDIERFAAALYCHEAAEDHVVQHVYNVAVDA
jgi:hemerythrin